MELVNRSQEMQILAFEDGTVVVVPPEVRHAELRTDIGVETYEHYYWIVEPRPSRWADEWIEVVW